MKSSLQQRGPGHGVMSCEFWHFNPAIVLYICSLQLQAMLWCFLMDHIFFPLFEKCNLSQNREERGRGKGSVSSESPAHLFWSSGGENSISSPWHTVQEAWSLTVFSPNLDFTLLVTLSPSQHFTFLAWTFIFSLPYLKFPAFYCCSWAALRFWACFIYLHPVWKQKLL